MTNAKKTISTMLSFMLFRADGVGCGEFEVEIRVVSCKVGSKWFSRVWIGKCEKALYHFFLLVNSANIVLTS